MRDGLIVAVTGVAIGMIAAWSLAPVLASFQYGVSLSDPILMPGITNGGSAGLFRASPKWVRQLPAALRL